MKGLVLLKLGGSLLTDKKRREKARAAVLRRLAREIAGARKKKKFALVIGHGSGGFAHYFAKKFGVKGIRGAALTADAAARLDRMLMKALLKERIPALSFPPSAWCTAEKGKIARGNTETIRAALKNKWVPVVFGDVTFGKNGAPTIVPTEEVLGFLGRKLGAKKMLVATKAEGVLDGKGKIIGRITEKNFGSLAQHVGPSQGVDVTGGMRGKVEQLLRIGKFGIRSLVFSGEIRGNVEKTLLGKRVPGTRIG